MIFSLSGSSQRNLLNKTTQPYAQTSQYIFCKITQLFTQSRNNLFCTIFFYATFLCTILPQTTQQFCANHVTFYANHATCFLNLKILYYLFHSIFWTKPRNLMPKPHNILHNHLTFYAITQQPFLYYLFSRNLLVYYPSANHATFCANHATCFLNLKILYYLFHSTFLCTTLFHSATICVPTQLFDQSRNLLHNNANFRIISILFLIKQDWKGFQSLAANISVKLLK
jgi:hypothetical protein